MDKKSSTAPTTALKARSENTSDFPSPGLLACTVLFGQLSDLFHAFKFVHRSVPLLLLPLPSLLLLLPLLFLLLTSCSVAPVTAISASCKRFAMSRLAVTKMLSHSRMSKFWSPAVPTKEELSQASPRTS